MCSKGVRKRVRKGVRNGIRKGVRKGVRKAVSASAPNPALITVYDQKMVQNKNIKNQLKSSKNQSIYIYIYTYITHTNIYNV